MVLLVVAGACICLLIYMIFLALGEVARAMGPLVLLVLGFIGVMMVPLNHWREELIEDEIHADIEREIRKPFYDQCFLSEKTRFPRETRVEKNFSGTSCIKCDCPFTQARYLEEGWYSGTFYPYFWPSAWTPWKTHRKLPVPITNGYPG